jgi:hypothetical protein
MTEVFIRRSGANSGPGRRRGGGERGSSVHGAGFHQFDAGAVRVPEINLPFAIYAGGDLDGAGITYARGALIEESFGLKGVGDFEADMVLFAAIGGRRELGVEHEFDVIGRFGEFDVYPAKGVAAFGPTPEFFGSEDVIIEGKGLFKVPDEDTGMHHTSGDASLREVLALFAAGPAVRGVLDDFDGMTVGISEVKV